MFRILKRVFGGPRSSLKPIEGYPSSIVDSLGCEFGLEMYYHIGYAYHLAQQGLLERTISSSDTECFYWFSPRHDERYTRRKRVDHFPTISQVSYESPDFDRWQVPDFAAQYRDQFSFGFEKPIVAIFNKYNSEWDGPPINFFSKRALCEFASSLKQSHQVIYFRPTSQIVLDDNEVFELDEKADLCESGVILGEDLYQKFSEVSFNTFQLGVLAQSKYRAVVQGGASYLNALFPGQMQVLHRRGPETHFGTYRDLERAAESTIQVHSDEKALFTTLERVMAQDASAFKAA